MKCPKCGSEDTYEDECHNTDCKYCGGLFFFCNNCDYTDHPECETNNE